MQLGARRLTGYLRRTHGALQHLLHVLSRGSGLPRRQADSSGHSFWDAVVALLRFSRWHAGHVCCLGKGAHSQHVPCVWVLLVAQLQRYSGGPGIAVAT
jgi:hypothetical protein